MFTENALHNITMVMTYEDERLTNPYTDENASLIWDDDTEQYIIVFWCETWSGYDVTEIKYTGSDNEVHLLDRLYAQGYTD